MPGSNVDKIYAEYKFLQEVRPRVKVESAWVKRWNQEFFSKSSNDYCYLWGFSTCTTSKILLLDEQGVIVTRVGRCWWNPFWTGDENVGQALARIGDKAQSIRYAVYLECSDSQLTLYRR